MTADRERTQKKASPSKRSESVSSKRDRALRIVELLSDAYPARIELDFENPLELAVATILSAQCTDSRVNEVTSTLFKKYRTAEDFANAEPEVLEEEIRSTGFFRNKTRSIISFAQALVDVHDGVVPNTMDELLKLAGIGRKTANVILGSGFGINEGVVVDTHVKRLSGRLGLTEQDDPVKIERDLMELIPQDEWNSLGLRMVLHGRYTCLARKPKCEGCPLEDVCPSAGEF